jgi:uncharacterized protein YcfJ
MPDVKSHLLCYLWSADHRHSEEIEMKTAFLSALMTSVIALTLTACTTDERRTAGYGVGGAAVGALAGGAIGGNARGALTGAAIGAAAGTLVGVAQTRNGVQYCRYRDHNGRVFEARCR